MLDAHHRHSSCSTSWKICESGGSDTTSLYLGPCLSLLLTHFSSHTETCCTMGVGSRACCSMTGIFCRYRVCQYRECQYRVCGGLSKTSRLCRNTCPTVESARAAARTANIPQQHEFAIIAYVEAPHVCCVCVYVATQPPRPKSHGRGASRDRSRTAEVVRERHDGRASGHHTSCDDSWGEECPAMAGRSHTDD